MNLKRLLVVMSAVTCLLAMGATLWAQTTISQGSIQGTITDPSGAVVAGASITITNRATGQVVEVTTTGSGTYNSGALLPGNYLVRVAAKGFRTVELPVVVQVAVTSPGSVKLQVGEATQVVEVQASSIQVNTEQATVQGVLTADQIDKLPVNGRNFLDLAQLEPGVQMQDGQTFDPTKAGYSSISINGVFGRTPRIELDGLDISDETVGTTTQNIGMGSIQEFNISRSGLDLSTELTSAGSVNVTTRSGTNAVHGQGFYNFRDRDAATANFVGDQSGYYQRNNFGGRVGGPIIKDKLFFFMDAERMKQDGFLPVIVPAPFSQLTSGYLSPFRDTSVTGKLDWQATKNTHVFYRFAYNWNKSEADFGYDYSVYFNRDNTPSQAVGVDITQGSWSHSFRFGYLKFHNMIGDSTHGASFYNPLPNDEIFFADTGVTLSGPNLLAPQGTFQSNKQLKYDGSKVYGQHVIRYGAGFNRILGGGFASFFGIAPQIYTLATACPNSDPTQCPFTFAVLGNGQGYFTERPQFNMPAGGQSDFRFQWYLGDSWKIKPNFTLTYGLRYNRDTGRSDSDLAPIPCSAVPAAIAPCTGSAPLFNQWGPGLGAPVRQPNDNFGPQLGFAWDPWKNGKTAVRAGAGVYYENYIFNNTLFDRPGKLAKGLFWSTGTLNCSAANGPGTLGFTLVPGNTVYSVDGKDLATQVCGQDLATAGPLVYDLQQEFQAAVKAQGPAANPSYIPSILTVNIPVYGLLAFAPNFRTARSYQFNVGIQRELWKGGVLTADYIRNISTHFQMYIDANHVGDARYLNVKAAQNAIAATTSAFKCSGGYTAAAIQCAIAAGATINNFAANGLDSGQAYFYGSPASVFGLTPDTGAAFPGINPAMGVGDFSYPMGRSVYNGLQTSYRQNVAHPMPGLASMNLQISYALSRFMGTGGNDQNFTPAAWDNNNPTYFMGPTMMDRTHQFKFGLTFDVAHNGPRFSVAGGFNSAAPSTLLFTTASGQITTGEIFRTDITGDGTVGDIFPTGNTEFGKPGQFMRSVSPASLAGSIDSWNSTQAGTLTPAGQALVAAGLFNTAQLQALGAVKPYVEPPPPGEVGNGIFKEFDMNLGWPIKLTERFNIEPSVSAFNVFNMANFGRLSGYLNNSVTLAGLTPGPAGNVNGTTPGLPRESVRIGAGSGVFNAGAPRQVEFGLKLNF